MVRATRILTLLLLLVLWHAFFITPFTNWDNQERMQTSKPSILPSFSSLSKASNFQTSKIFNRPNDSTWIPLIPGFPNGTPPEIKMKNQDHDKISILVKIFGMWNWTEKIDGIDYDVLEIPCNGHFTIAGNPQLPFIPRFVAVPRSSTVTASIKQDMSLSQIIEGNFNVKPYPGPFYPDTISTAPNVTANPVVYNTNAFYPSKNITLGGAFVNSTLLFRGVRYLAMSMVPIQYNPVTQKLRAFSHMAIELTFNPPGEIEVSPSLMTPLFQQMFAQTLLNPGFLFPSSTFNLTSKGSSHHQESACQYIIITPQKYYDEVKDLRDWKQRKGIPTEIFTVEYILDGLPRSEENNRTQIREFIRGAYTNWVPAPDYVLFVGDADDIPPFYEMEHTCPWAFNTLIGTDLYYFTVDVPAYEDDSIPDLFYGRLSVDTLEDVEAMVQKIRDYEQAPPSNDEFYHIVSIADRQATDVEPNITPIDNLLTGNDVLFESIMGWFMRNDVIDSLNAGRFLACYMGHGTSQNYRYFGQPGYYDGWQLRGDPFTTEDFSDILITSNEYPVVLSMTCMTGWFDGETDKNSQGICESILEDHNDECFCEILTRMAGNRAVAAIGATRHADLTASALVLQGILDGLYPHLDLTRPNPDTPFEVTPSLGVLLCYGKWYLASYEGYADEYDRIHQTMQLYHLFGDPEMTLSTQQLSNLEVDYPAYIGSGGLQSFVVTVTDEYTRNPVKDARVCLQKEDGVDTIYESKLTSYKGYAIFEVTPSTGGPMNITVTRANYVPCIKEITVTSDGAVISVSPSSGSEGDQVLLSGSKFTPETNLNINFGKDPVPEDERPTTNAEGEFGILREWPITVLSGSSGPVNIIASEEGSKVAVTLFTRHRLGADADPFLYCQEYVDTWFLNPMGSGWDVNPRWNNPDIQIIPLPWGYQVKARIHNSGPEEATNFWVYFEYSDLGVGQGSISGQLDWIRFDARLTSVEANRYFEVESIGFPLVPPFCINVSLEYDGDICSENNYGIENFYNRTVTTRETFQESLEIRIYNSPQEPWLFLQDITGTPLDPLMKATITGPSFTTPNFATVNVFVDESASIGSSRTILIHNMVGNDIVGGIEILLQKKVLESPDGCPCLILLIIVILVIIVLIIAIYLIRKRRSK